MQRKNRGGVAEIYATGPPVLTQYLDGVYKVPLGAVPNLASVVALVGVPDVLHLQIVPYQGYPGVHADYLLAGAYEGGASLPHDHERSWKSTRKCLYCRNTWIIFMGRGWDEDSLLPLHEKVGRYGYESMSSTLHISYMGKGDKKCFASLWRSDLHNFASSVFYSKLG